MEIYFDLYIIFNIFLIFFFSIQTYRFLIMFDLKMARFNTPSIDTRPFIHRINFIILICNNFTYIYILRFIEELSISYTPESLAYGAKFNTNKFELFVEIIWGCLHYIKRIYYQ